MLIGATPATVAWRAPPSSSTPACSAPGLPATSWMEQPASPSSRAPRSLSPCPSMWPPTRWMCPRRRPKFGLHRHSAAALHSGTRRRYRHPARRRQHHPAVGYGTRHHHRPWRRGHHRPRRQCQRRSRAIDRHCRPRPGHRARRSGGPFRVVEVADTRTDALSTSTEPVASTYVPGLSHWLGAQSVIDVSGQANLFTDALGRRSGASQLRCCDEARPPC